MDRRQRKTRNAIFAAFISLLEQKSYGQITVGDIIDQADIGRATFYAHFETKDYLLKALCHELFCHISDGTCQNQIFHCDAEDSVFLHLIRHLQKNDNHSLSLLTCRNHELFLGYFQNSLRELVESQLFLFAQKKHPALPESFWIDHITATFVQTVKWWLENGCQESPEKIAEYFFLAV
jgi:AcrR family transcriptional regulator